MADKVKIWFDAEADYLEVRFSEAAGSMTATQHDAVMERVDAKGRVIGFSILGVSRFKKDKPLEAELFSISAPAVVREKPAKKIWEVMFLFGYPLFTQRGDYLKRLRQPSETLPMRVVVLILMLAAIGCDESKHPPPYKSQSNVSVYYSSLQIDPGGKSAYVIKDVVQERTVMRYKSADLGNGSHYWYIAPEPVWQKRYLCRSGIDGRNPAIAAELPDDRFSYEYSWGDQEYMRLSGILGFDVSWSQQTVAFIIGRRTNSIEILDLKTGVWTEFSLYDPKRPERGERNADSLQFINNSAVVLASAGNNILVTIDPNGHENIKNIENEIRDALPTNSNRRSIDVQQFVGRPVWNEEQKLIAVMGHESALLFDTNLVFQQAIQIWLGNRSRKLANQDRWVLEGTYNHQSPQSFTLVNHKLADTTISSNEAAAVW